MASIDYKGLLLQFIASLTLCDHMGDVADDVSKILKTIGLKIEWEDWHDLGNKLAKMGVTTLYGTLLREEECGEGDEIGGE